MALDQPEQKYHIVITGGSSGIGLAVAKKMSHFHAVANITIIARNEDKLADAKAEIEKGTGRVQSHELQVHTLSLDLSVTTDAAFKNLSVAVSRHCDTNGAPSMLFNCAGTSQARTFEDSDMSLFRHLMAVNYMGTVAATRAFLPLMKSNGGGRIVITSSGAGQIGLYGYTAYSGSKFALRGFAEALAMETPKDNIYVTMAYPPNTETPGFEHENLDKPEVTRAMEDAAGLFRPEKIADSMVKAAIFGSYSCYWGLEGWMLTMVTGGMGPVDNLGDFLSQVVLGGVLRLVGTFVLMDFRRIAKKYSKQGKAVAAREGGEKKSN
jgi:3-dehydrosphinganine reductase